MAQSLDHFVNLRIFGCFDASESQARPVRRCLEQLRQQKPFLISGDRPFDMISVTDLVTVVRAVLDGNTSDNDINVVYNTKYKLSEILTMHAQLHNLDTDLIQIESTNPMHYTGDGTRLARLSLPLQGLETSLRNYK
jgi:nucleoside-diphosphate-sugar epimerase